ncbi:MAG: SpoIIIAH-like family protein, partial [Oscillospiraceae bacterium]
FAQARIDRMNARDEAVETLQTIMNGGDATEDEKAVIAEKALALSKLVEAESKVESLIKAAGFDDCVVYLDGESANIVVKCSEALIPSQAAQIKDILLNEIAIENEKIRIREV